MSEDKGERVDKILKRMVEQATPAVMEIVDRDISGSIEFHFDKGKYGTGKKHLGL